MIFSSKTQISYRVLRSIIDTLLSQGAYQVAKQTLDDVGGLTELLEKISYEKKTTKVKYGEETYELHDGAVRNFIEHLARNGHRAPNTAIDKKELPTHMKNLKSYLKYDRTKYENDPIDLFVSKPYGSNKYFLISSIELS